MCALRDNEDPFRLPPSACKFNLTLFRRNRYGSALHGALGNARLAFAKHSRKLIPNGCKRQMVWQAAARSTNYCISYTNAPLPLPTQTIYNYHCNSRQHEQCVAYSAVALTMVLENALYTTRALHQLRSEAQRPSSVKLLITLFHDKCMLSPRTSSR